MNQKIVLVTIVRFVICDDMTGDNMTGKRIYFNSEDYKVIKKCQDEIDELMELIRFRQDKIDEIIRNKGVNVYDYQKNSGRNTVRE